MGRRDSRLKRSGASLDDATLIKAFVWRVSASDDEVLVTLNYDVENNEPARLDVLRFVQMQMVHRLRISSNRGVRCRHSHLR